MSNCKYGSHGGDVTLEKLVEVYKIKDTMTKEEFLNFKNIIKRMNNLSIYDEKHMILQLDKELTDLRSRYAELEITSNGAVTTSKLYDSLLNEHNDLVAKHKELSDCYEIQSNDLKELNEVYKSLRERKQILEKDLNESRENFFCRDQQLKKLKADHEALKNEYKELEHDYELSRKDNEALKKDIESLNKENLFLSDELDKTKQKLDQAFKKIEELTPIYPVGVLAETSNELESDEEDDSIYDVEFLNQIVELEEKYKIKVKSSVTTVEAYDLLNKLYNLKKLKLDYRKMVKNQ